MIDMEQQRDNPNSPEELGRRLLAACRWCDDVRRLALEGVRSQHPDASPQELDEMLYEFRMQWERVGHRLRRRQAAIRGNG
jgi:hypothetical protein